MIFRAFCGEPVPEARELEEGPPAPRRGPHQPGHRRGRGHRRRLPRPRAPHRRARAADEDRDGRARGRSRSSAASLQIPRVTHVVDHFLEPTFADSPYYEELEPTSGLTAFGLGARRRARRSPASRSPTASGCRSPAPRPRCASASRRCTSFFVNKWYFDELIDVARRAAVAWFGRFARSTFERVFVNGLLVGGTTGVVRAGSAAVRAAQTGFLRDYAALLLLGMAASASTSWWRD